MAKQAEEVRKKKLFVFGKTLWKKYVMRLLNQIEIKI